MAFHDDPVDFMEKNVVLVGNVRNTSGEADVKLNESSDNVYKLEAGAGAGSFRIYWCHYKSDDVLRITLGRNANFMFTPRMNGCSFAVGVPAADGAVTVAHANVKDDPQSAALIQVDQALKAKKLPTWAETMRLQTLRRQLVMVEQKDKLTRSLRSDQFSGYLSSSTYQSAELTTFGVRDTGTNQWSFYFQARSGNSANQIIGCFPIHGRVQSTRT